ncbi:MAG: DUF1614 domain-containing protein [Thermoplasmatota archaeon]
MAAIVLIGILVPAGAVSAQVQQVLIIPQDNYLTFQLQNASGGENFSFSLRTDGAAIDVLFIPANQLAAYSSGRSFHAYPPTRLNVVTDSGRFTVPSAGTWYFVLDNTPIPSGGAYAGRDVTVQVDLTQTGSGSAFSANLPAAPTLLNALDFASPYWLVTSVWGVAGITLWMVAVAAFTIPSDKRVILWTAAVTVTAFAFSWPDPQGILVRLGPPISVGIIVAFLAALRARSLWEGLKTSYFATFIGTLLGGDILSILLKGVTVQQGAFGVIGGAQFQDALFVAPLTAVLWYSGLSAVGVLMGIDALQPTRRPQRAVVEFDCPHCGFHQAAEKFTDGPEKGNCSACGLEVSLS